MITRIEISNNKSFKNFSSPEGDSFSEINFIYGKNGSGKTTLSEELEREAERQNCNVVRYSRAYVKENFLIDESESIKAVKGTFGKKSNRDIKKLKELLEQKDEILSDIEELKKAKVDNCKTARSLYVAKLDKFKGRSGVKNLRAQDYGEDNLDIYNQAEDIITKHKEDALFVEPNKSKILEVNGNIDYEKKIEELKRIALKSLDISEIELDEIREIFNKKYDDNSPGYELIQWLESGLKEHNDGDKCKFCKQGSVNINNITKEIERYKSSTKVKDSKKLDKINQKLLIIKENLIVIEKNEDYSEYKKRAKDLDEALVSIISNVDNKISSMHKTIKFDSSSLKELIDLNNKAINHIEDEIEKLKTISNKINILIKGAIAIEYLGSDKYKALRNEYEELNDKIDLKKDAENKIVDKILELESHKLDIDEFIKNANDMLDDLDIHFVLSPDNSLPGTCLIKSRDGNNLSIDSISEGEQNILALLWFYHELFTDKGFKDSGGINESIGCVIIDDPYTSLDNDNQIYILQIMKDICNRRNKNSQIFIFTHSWDMYVDLSYQKKRSDGVCRKSYRLDKTNGVTNMKIDDKVIESTYKTYIKELYKYKEGKNEDFEKYAPNVMRRIIEEFSSFYMGNKAITNTNNICMLLLREEENKVSNNKNQKIKVLVSVSNIFSHRINRDPDPNDVKNSAKFLMECLKANHKIHYNKMIN